MTVITGTDGKDRITIDEKRGDFTIDAGAGNDRILIECLGDNHQLSSRRILPQIVVDGCLRFPLFSHLFSSLFVVRFYISCLRLSFLKISRGLPLTLTF